VITQRILSQVRPGAIILSHDIHKQTVDAMPATLDGLIAKGYKFVTVSQLIALNKPKPPAPVAAANSKAPKAKKTAPVSTANQRTTAPTDNVIKGAPTPAAQ
jgi:hypothetical protein